MQTIISPTPLSSSIFVDTGAGISVSKVFNARNVVLSVPVFGRIYVLGGLVLSRTLFFLPTHPQFRIVHREIFLISSAVPSVHRVALEQRAPAQGSDSHPLDAFLAGANEPRTELIERAKGDRRGSTAAKSWSAAPDAL